MEWMAEIWIYGFILLFFSVLPPLFHYLWVKSAMSALSLPENSNFYPRITIFLPVKNEEIFITRKLKEILSMDYPSEKIFLIVVDSNSKDSTVELAKTYLTSNLETKNWRIDNISENGKSFAVNRTLDLIETEFFVMMDADAICPPDSLKNLISWFSDYKIGAVCGQYDTDKNCTDIAYRSRFNITRIGESVIDSTPIFEGSICAFRTKAIGESRVFEGINADDSQLAIICRSNGFKSVMDPRIKFFEDSNTISRSRKVRRAQGIIRTLFAYKSLSSGNGNFSRIMFNSIYFNTLFPWAIILSVSILFFSSIFILSVFSSETTNPIPLVPTFLLVLTKTGRGLINGSSILIEAQLKLLMGVRLNKWEPERA